MHYATQGSEPDTVRRLAAHRTCSIAPQRRVRIHRGDQLIQRRHRLRRQRLARRHAHHRPAKEHVRVRRPAREGCQKGVIAGK